MLAHRESEELLMLLLYGNVEISIFQIPRHHPATWGKERQDGLQGGHSKIPVSDELIQSS